MYIILVVSSQSFLPLPNGFKIPKNEHQKTTRAMDGLRNGIVPKEMVPNFPNSRRNWKDCPGETNTGGSLMVGRISRIKITLRIREKRQIFQATRVELAKPWRWEQNQRSEVMERRKHQEGRTQGDFGSVRVNTGGKTGGNIAWNVRNYLKLFPEALLDFICGLCQFAELPDSALDLGSVDPGGVQGLGTHKQHRLSQQQPWKDSSNTNPLT